MSKFTDNLMKQIQGYAEFASTSMNRLDQHVDFSGKTIAEESFNEINKMLYRIKDFQSVYNISENKFRQKEEDFQIRKTIDDVLEVAKNDI